MFLTPAKLLYAFLLSLLVTLLMVHPESKAASSCGADMTPQDAYQRATAVFSGTVEEVRSLYDTAPKLGGRPPYLQVRIKVERSWKLVDQREVILRTNTTDGGCGYFEAGQAYLVYADQMYDTLYVSARSRTTRIEEAHEDLASLGTARLSLGPGEYRVHTIFAYGILTYVLLALLLGIYVYRLMKTPLRAR